MLIYIHITHFKIFFFKILVSTLTSSLPKLMQQSDQSVQVRRVLNVVLVLIDQEITHEKPKRH